MKMSDLSWKGHLSMLCANSMWGLMSPMAKFVILGGAVTPLVLTDMRIFGAMVLFWIGSLFKKQEHIPPKDMLRLFGAALLGIVFNQGCFIFGVGLTSPADASIITTSMPLWAMILAAFILKEPITAKKVIGIALGATGAMLLIFGGGNEAGSANGNSYAIFGDILVLCAQLSYALYLVLYKDFVNKYSLFTIMKWMFTYSFICVTPFAANDIMAADWQLLTMNQILYIGFIVVCATFLAYVLIVVGQQRLRPTVAGMYNYVQPIVACIVAVCWGMDSFNVVKGIAVVLIFSGVYQVSTSKSRKDMKLEIS